MHHVNLFSLFSIFITLFILSIYLIIMTNVKLTTKYNLSKIDKKLIKIMKNIVLNSKLQKNF
jgi:hypothetical protein